MVPWSAPLSEIWTRRASIDASTRPSTTSVSQSVISAPFSLMSGPTISLLPLVSSGFALTSGSARGGSARTSVAADVAGSRARASRR